MGQRVIVSNIREYCSLTRFFFGFFARSFHSVCIYSAGLPVGPPTASA